MKLINQIKECRYDERTIIQIKKSLRESLFAERRRIILMRIYDTQSKEDWNRNSLYLILFKEFPFSEGVIWTQKLEE